MLFCIGTSMTALTQSLPGKDKVYLIKKKKYTKSTNEKKTSLKNYFRSADCNTYKSFTFIQSLRSRIICLLINQRVLMM